MSDYEMYELGDVTLQSGLTLRQARLADKTYGNLNTARDNVIVMPTFYGGLEVEQMPNAELRPIPSIWGHGGGFGVNPLVNEFIDAALKELLQAD